MPENPDWILATRPVRLKLDAIVASAEHNLAFERLVRPHFDRLYRLAWRLTGARAEAEDLFQELLVKAFTKLDDLVEIDENRGVVESIGNRSTRIKRVDGVHLMVPNSQMLERVVVNWTLVDRKFRSMIRVGVVYGSPVHRVRDLLIQAAQEHRETLAEPTPIVIFEDFGDNALIFDLFFWCEAQAERDLRMIRSDIRFRIDEMCRENDIVIAFPQRDVHLYAKTPIDIRTQTGSGDPAREGGR